MVKCCVPLCKNSPKGSKMHILPKDKKIRIQWSLALDKKNLIDVESKEERQKYRVCSAHFEQTATFISVRNKTNLKYDSIPTLFLPCSSTSLPNSSSCEASAPMEIDSLTTTSVPSAVIPNSNLEMDNKQTFGRTISQVATTRKGDKFFNFIINKLLNLNNVLFACSVNFNLLEYLL
ncbi:unnamed protein product [Psylliodes chrysocephalus]|uniref:THAP-type domain-containing protein n=1 Tax=Psylliodes chrysocephalus TaxID=3402493 RepID=A0A9P0GIR9_9CUCU|nr:unnamed protein product [Psylliodes chrysocephala]